MVAPLAHELARLLLCVGHFHLGFRNYLQPFFPQYQVACWRTGTNFYLNFETFKWLLDFPGFIPIMTLTTATRIIMLVTITNRAGAANAQIEPSTGESQHLKLKQVFRMRKTTIVKVFHLFIHKSWLKKMSIFSESNKIRKVPSGKGFWLNILKNLKLIILIQ